ncbi:MAG: hypothetical protein R3F49_08890 [Planctomycetota bacterium]
MARHISASAFVLSLAAFVSTWSPAPTPVGASAPESSATNIAIPEIDSGGYVLYQPFDGTDSQVDDGLYPKVPVGEARQYAQTIVRWTAVGFLRVEAVTTDGVRQEHWYLSKATKASSVTASPVSIVDQYFWPGRISPTAEKHTYWNNLPIRFLRRNDLSGAADLDEFVEEVEATYGYDLKASAGDFTRYDAAAAKAAGY